MIADRVEAQMECASRKDDVAIEQLLQEHLSALYGHIQYQIDPLIRKHESCADIVQSVCREVIEHQQAFEYRGHAEFRSWLFKMALHKLVDRKRYYLAEKRDAKRAVYISNISTCSRIEDVYQKICSPSQAVSTKEETDLLERVLEQLSPDHQMVIYLSRFVGMGQAEIAEIMSRSVPAVRTLLHRALGRLGLLMHRAQQS